MRKKIAKINIFMDENNKKEYFPHDQNKNSTIIPNVLIIIKF